MRAKGVCQCLSINQTVIKSKSTQNYNIAKLSCPHYTSDFLNYFKTSCLTAVTTHVIRYCEKVYERSGKNFFWSIKYSGEVINKLKLRGRATSLSANDFSTFILLCRII